MGPYVWAKEPIHRFYPYIHDSFEKALNKRAIFYKRPSSARSPSVIICRVCIYEMATSGMNIKFVGLF